MEATSTLVLYFISGVIALIYLYLSWNFNFWKKQGVNGPEPKLIFGSIPCVVKRNRNLIFDIQDLYEKYKMTGERFIGIFMTRNPQILVIDPCLAREILVTNFKAFRGTEASLWANKKEEVSSRNPFMNSGSAWKAIRIEVIRGLSPNRIKQEYPVVLEICKKLTNFVKASNLQTGKSIEIKTLCYKYTTEIIADFVWGINADALKLDESSSPNQLLDMSRKMMDASFDHIGFYNLSGLVPFIRRIFARRFYPEETDNFFAHIQKDALEMRLRNKNNRTDFLNYLIQLQEKQNISHMNMVGHSLTVLQDGYETTAFVMAHTLYFLANNQDIQTKLREEIMANVDGNGYLGYEELIELSYLDQCISETIRITTVVGGTSRICSEETILENRENHKVKIDPGMVVHIPSYSFHHDSEVYPNPEEYIPERFDNGRAKELNQKGYFFPFGDGPRVCPGMRLGQLEAKAGIVEIFKNFNLKIANESERVIDPKSVILGLASDIFLEFKAIPTVKT